MIDMIKKSLFILNKGQRFFTLSIKIVSLHVLQQNKTNVTRQ
jgi:hypothetical protein